MGLTAWKTYASGDNATAADRNSYERDNGRWLSHAATGGAPMCRVERASDYTHSSTGSSVAVPFDTERFDVGGMHDTGANTERITIPTGGGGKYLIGACVEFDTNTTGQRGVQIAESAGSLEIVADLQDAADHGANPVRIAVATVWQFAAADYAVCRAYQNSGGNLALKNSGAYSPEFWAIWLGE